MKKERSRVLQELVTEDLTWSAAEDPEEVTFKWKLGG